MTRERSRRRLLALSGTATLVVAALVATPVTGQAAPRAPGGRAATSHVSTVHLRTSTRAMPTSRVHHGGGAVVLSEKGRLQRFVDRSHSPRPKVVRTASGARRLASTAPTGWLPRVAPTPVRARRPGAATGWLGLTEADNAKFAGFSVEPPDQGLCAGGGRVMEMINDLVRVSTVTGRHQRTTYLNDFFGEPVYQFATDPSCVVDGGNGRYYATSLILGVDPTTGNLTGQDWLDLAVSKTRNPLGGWNIYRIDVTDDGSNGTPQHTDCPCIGDFPHLATDSHGVFLTTNEYPFSAAPGLFGNNFNGAQVYALSKTRTASGAADVPMVHLENVRVPPGKGPVRVGFTLWPAQAAGNGYATAHHGTVYFVSSFAADEARPTGFTGHAAAIGTWWIGNTASLDSHPALTLREKTLPTGSYGVPPLANQKPGPVPLRDCIVTQCEKDLGGPYSPEQEGGLDSSDTRVLTAVYAHGRVYSALDTALQVSGSLQAGFQWVAVRAAGTASSRTAGGYVGVDRANAVFPAIATDKAGRGYVGFTLAGADRYPSAGYTRWSGGPGSALHVLAAGAAPQDGFCQYLAFDCGDTDPPSIRPRWGDYGYGAWDGKRFFLAGEYIAHRCTFATFATDHSCGGTRTFEGNFATHVHRLR